MVESLRGVLSARRSITEEDVAAARRRGNQVLLAERLRGWRR
jgi:hypothetical protein